MSAKGESSSASTSAIENVLSSTTCTCFNTQELLDIERYSMDSVDLICASKVVLEKLSLFFKRSTSCSSSSSRDPTCRSKEETSSSSSCSIQRSSATHTYLSIPTLEGCQKQRLHIAPLETYTSRLQTIENGRGDVKVLILLFEEIIHTCVATCTDVNNDIVQYNQSVGIVKDHLILLNKFHQTSQAILQWLNDQTGFIENRTDIYCGFLLRNISLVSGLGISTEKQLVDNQFNIFKMACNTRSNVDVVYCSFALVVCYADSIAKGTNSMFGGTTKKYEDFHFYTGSKADKRVKGRKYERLVAHSRNDVDDKTKFRSWYNASYHYSSEDCLEQSTSDLSNSDQQSIIRIIMEKKRCQAACDASARDDPTEKIQKITSKAQNVMMTSAFKKVKTFDSVQYHSSESARFNRQPCYIDSSKSCQSLTSHYHCSISPTSSPTSICSEQCETTLLKNGLKKGSLLLAETGDDRWCNQQTLYEEMRLKRTVIPV